MSHEKIKSLFSSAVSSVVSSIADYAVNPGKDFTRCKKFLTDKLITFWVSEGSSSTKNELLDFFSMDALSEPSEYSYLAADGSAATYFSHPEFSPTEFFVEPGHSAKGFYSIHINAFYDIADRHTVLPGSKNVYIGDRGYCSYNNMAHVMEKQQYFLLRTKDIHSKGLVGSFDIPINVTLTRSRFPKIQVGNGYRRFVDKATSFDFIAYGSMDTYGMSFRVARFPVSDETWVCHAGLSSDRQRRKTQ